MAAIEVADDATGRSNATREAEAEAGAKRMPVVGVRNETGDIHDTAKGVAKAAMAREALRRLAN